MTEINNQTKSSFNNKSQLNFQKGKNKLLTSETDIKKYI